MSSTLSKDEILEKHYPDFDKDSGWIFAGPVEDVFKAMGEYAHIKIIDFLRWLISPRKKMTISSGEGCFYINGNEITYEELFELYDKQNKK